jgi:hypothetical protein
MKSEYLFAKARALSMQLDALQEERTWLKIYRASNVLFGQCPDLARTGHG